MSTLHGDTDCCNYIDFFKYITIPVHHRFPHIFNKDQKSNNTEIIPPPDLYQLHNVTVLKILLFIVSTKSGI
jgi:hypothetical protein